MVFGQNLKIWTAAHSFQLARNVRDSPGFLLYQSVPCGYATELLSVPEATDSQLSFQLIIFIVINVWVGLKIIGGCGLSPIWISKSWNLWQPSVISSEMGSEGEQNGTGFSFIAPSSEEL